MGSRVFLLETNTGSRSLSKHDKPMIQVLLAHPSFRDELIRVRKEFGIVVHGPNSDGNRCLDIQYDKHSYVHCKQPYF